MSELTHFWRWKCRLPERKGQECRVIARGRLNSCLVEFSDGLRVVTSRYAIVKKATAERPGETFTFFDSTASGRGKRSRIPGHPEVSHSQAKAGKPGEVFT